MFGTRRRTRTSPGPGSVVSSFSILVEIVPGLSYTTALYFLGMSNVFCVTAAAMFAIRIGFLFWLGNGVKLNIYGFK